MNVAFGNLEVHVWKAHNETETRFEARDERGNLTVGWTKDLITVKMAMDILQEALANVARGLS